MLFLLLCTTMPSLSATCKLLVLLGCSVSSAFFDVRCDPLHSTFRVVLAVVRCVASLDIASAAGERASGLPSSRRENFNIKNSFSTNLASDFGVVLKLWAFSVVVVGGEDAYGMSAGNSIRRQVILE